MRQSTVAASLVIDMVGHFSARGIAVGALCAAARLDPAFLDAPDERVPGAVVERLWQAGEAMTGDPDVGLHSAESFNPGALNVVGYAVLSSRTAGEALARLGRYAAILNDGLRVTLEGGTCRFEAVEGLENYLLQSPRQVMEALATGVVVTLRNLTLGGIEPRAVRFRHAAPASTAEHRRVFGREPAFAQAENALEFTARELDRPLRSSNAALLPIFEARSNALLERLDRLGPVSRRLLTEVAIRMQGALPTLAEIAVALAMSTRNLQRALSGEGTTYQELLDEARRELALRHLAAPGGTAAEVAFLLGFSDASAFTRAFRRWTGTTPGAWRQRAATGITGSPGARASD